MISIAYFDCFSGISGDMIIGAFIDAGMNFPDFEKEINKLKLPQCELTFQKVLKNHITATKFDIREDGNSQFRNIQDLNAILDHSDLAENIKHSAKKIFLKIANAESAVHDQPLEDVHFHEIGAVDTIIDVVGVLIGLDMLGIDKIVCSKLNVGTGFISSAHGEFPVPAPATALLLQGLPIYSTGVKAELVTPTGAAIISTLAESFGDMPDLTIENIGYGAGTRNLDHPNLLRVFFGHSTGISNSSAGFVSTIKTNIDDMNPQLYDHVIDKLFKNGALDVYLTNIFMKKNRPAIQLTVLANCIDEDRMIRLVFEETTTIGLRITREKRKTLKRQIVEKSTKFGRLDLRFQN